MKSKTKPRRAPARLKMDAYQRLYAHLQAMQHDGTLAALHCEIVSMEMTGKKSNRCFALVLQQKIPPRRRRRKSKR